eukprot:12185627-Alexandrium_andersonii.AAC.1
MSPELMTGVASRVHAVARYSGSVRLKAASAGMAVGAQPSPGWPSQALLVDGPGESGLSLGRRCLGKLLRAPLLKS